MSNENSISATLLKRIAEAVDGTRTGEDVYVVASDVFPHDVAGVYPVLDAATAAMKKNDDHRVHGPYTTTRDTGAAVAFAPFCHDPYSNRCPFTRPEPAWKLDDIADITVTATRRDGKKWSASFSPAKEKVDALLFTLAAADKFYIPYIAKVAGAKHAAQIRDEMAAYASTAT